MAAINAVRKAAIIGIPLGRSYRDLPLAVAEAAFRVQRWDQSVQEHDAARDSFFRGAFAAEA